MASSGLDRIVVSTDDEAIAGAAASAGAEVPFLRPPELSSDTATSIAVVTHSLDFLAGQGYSPDSLMLLQPTSPFRAPEDICNAIALLEASRRHDAVMSVAPPAQSPFWAKTMEPDGTLRTLLEDSTSRRQELPTVYVPNGAIYLVRISAFRETDSLYPEGRTLGYPMPEERSLDIDTPYDLEIARALVASRLDRDKAQSSQFAQG